MGVIPGIDLSSFLTFSLSIPLLHVIADYNYVIIDSSHPNEKCDKSVLETQSSMFLILFCFAQHHQNVMKFHLLCFRIRRIQIYQADYQQSSNNLPSRVRDEEHLVMNHFPWLNILLINDDDTSFLFGVIFSILSYILYCIVYILTAVIAFFFKEMWLFHYYSWSLLICQAPNGATLILFCKNLFNFHGYLYSNVNMNF